MKLTINLEPLRRRFDTETCAGIYAEAGFEACDYSLESLTRDDEPFLSDAWQTYAQSVRGVLEKAKLPVVQTHAPFHFRVEQWEKHFEDICFPRLVRAVEVSATLGAKIVVMHPLHWMVYHGHEEEIFARNMAFYRRMIPVCRANGIRMGVENMWQPDEKRGFPSHDTCSRKEEFVRYIDTLDSEYMVATLDVGHVGLPQQDDEAADVIRYLGHDRLHSLHIHDNDCKGDQHIYPFFGKMDWESITKALGEIDYDGDFTYEVKAMALDRCPESFVPTAARFLADIGRWMCGEIDRNRPVKG